MDQALHLRLGQTETGDDLQQVGFVVVYNGAQLRYQLEQAGVSLAHLRDAPATGKPRVDDVGIRNALEVGRKHLRSCRGCRCTFRGYRRRHGGHLHGQLGVEQGLVLVQHIALGHQEDAPCHILHGRVGLEAHILREALLCLVGSHARGQGKEYVCTATHRVFYQQYLPLAFGLQGQGACQDFFGMALLVEVHHQPLQGLQGIAVGTAVVLEGSAVGCPDGQGGLQFFPPLAYLSALVGQLGIEPATEHFATGSRTSRRGEPRAYAGKSLFLVHSWFSLRVR